MLQQFDFVAAGKIRSKTSFSQERLHKATVSFYRDYNRKKYSFLNVLSTKYKRPISMKEIDLSVVVILRVVRYFCSG